MRFLLISVDFHAEISLDFVQISAAIHAKDWYFWKSSAVIQDPPNWGSSQTACM